MALLSNSRFAALDETAVFGSICHHEFPLLFLNMKHGERLAKSKHRNGKLKVTALQVGVSSVSTGEIAAGEPIEGF